ncbi:hypothetical protein CEXT_510481 [Caerostris extrusa]|uniref:Uncharacterized protein n=1 Tax=Caerostris extrusa TaxID=172846 RepID=A0AAV4V093_CAEEX|nr:hypothetical protein CEXT_510481 [Caerostris extrusa]
MWKGMDSPRLSSEDLEGYGLTYCPPKRDLEGYGLTYCPPKERRGSECNLTYCPPEERPADMGFTMPSGRETWEAWYGTHFIVPQRETRKVMDSLYYPKRDAAGMNSLIVLRRETPEEYGLTLLPSEERPWKGMDSLIALQLETGRAWTHLLPPEERPGRAWTHLVALRRET